jgi:hypothetical protein
LEKRDIQAAVTFKAFNQVKECILEFKVFGREFVSFLGSLLVSDGDKGDTEATHSAKERLGIGSDNVHQETKETHADFSLFFIMAGVQLFLIFWYNTRLTGHLGPVQPRVGTPSFHSVSAGNVPCQGLTPMPCPAKAS